MRCDFIKKLDLYLLCLKYTAATKQTKRKKHPEITDTIIIQPELSETEERKKYQFTKKYIHFGFEMCKIRYL